MAYYDSMAEEYDSWFEQKGKLIFAIEIQSLLQVLPSLPKPWLEIGVGSGRFASALKINSGLDPSVKLFKMAKNRGVNPFLGNGEYLPFKNNVFGTVFIIHTLYFLTLPEEVLIETNRILNKNGELVIGTVLQESPRGQLYELKKKKRPSLL